MKPGGQGAHREVGSEGLEEKFRAVINEMNRSAKAEARSSPHYGGEGVLIHSAYQGVCGRHGAEGMEMTQGGLGRCFGDRDRSKPGL